MISLILLLSRVQNLVQILLVLQIEFMCRKEGLMPIISYFLQFLSFSRRIQSLPKPEESLPQLFMVVDLFLHLLVPLTVIFDLLDSVVKRKLKFFDPLFEFLHQLTLNNFSFIFLRYQHAYLIRYCWLASLFRTLFFCCWFRKCNSVSQDHCLLTGDDLCYLYQRIIVHTCVVVLNSYLIIKNYSLWWWYALIL